MKRRGPDRVCGFGLARTREVLWVRKDEDTWSPVASEKARALAPGEVLVMPVA